MIQKPKGTKDIYGNDQQIYSLIFKTFEDFAKSYNFQKITTPIFESIELFRKTSGDTSDIITKELYSFKDLSNRELALRPEGTASIARAIIENNLLNEKKYHKLFYIGPMFRYEKPQKGRMRQFDQIGIELINNTSTLAIIEVLTMAKNFLQKLQINNYVLKINNIGTTEERENYKKDLSKYFNQFKNELSELSISRIEINPLRILDDKIDAYKEIVINAPKITNYLSESSKLEFTNLLFLFDELKILYEVDYSLVRGLDYYTNVVFEFISDSRTLGAKSTIIGGGCYENLIKNSKYEISGVGFGIGVERLFEILKSEKVFPIEYIDFYFIFNNQEEFQNLFPLICELRNQGLKIEFNKKFTSSKKSFTNALSFNPNYIIYYDLFKNSTNRLITIKNQQDNSKIELDLENLKKHIFEKGITSE